MFDQTFHAAQAFGEREQLTPFEKALCSGEIPIEDHRDDAAEVLHLALGKCVLRMAFEPWIDHPFHFGARFEPARNPESVGTVALHAQRQRLDPAEREKTVERSLDRAN